jgi:hypothetical protein
MAAIVEAARVGGKTSLVEGYQILQCGDEYPGSGGGDTILRNVGSYKSHTVSSPRR